MISNDKKKCSTCPNRENGIFCGIDSLSLESIGQHKIVNDYKKSSTIFYQGNPPFGIYCVLKGKVKLTKVGNDGKESIVRIAKNGDVLGHRSLFSHENYTSTATTIEDSVICFIDKKFIFELIQTNPQISINLLHKLSLEMGLAEKISTSMAQKNVRQRLAEVLLYLQENFGTQELNRHKLDIRLTREELASMIGTAVETVIRVVSDFKNANLIDEEEKHLYILNVEGLRRIIDSDN